MKIPFLTFVCLLGAFPFTMPLETRADDRQASTNAAPATPPATWSVVGTWTCKHLDPDWDGPVTICADGTFFRPDFHPSSGHWTLSTVHDRVLLVFAWDGWPAETVTMINSDKFWGKEYGNGKDGEMTLYRIKPPEGEAAPFETRTWRQGEAPVRLIRKEEGFCALTMVTGSFQGAGEMVRIYMGDDGYWYLGGDSHQEGVAAECIVVRYGKGK